MKTRTDSPVKIRTRNQLLITPSPKNMSFCIGFNQFIQNKEMNFSLTKFYANMGQMSLEMKVNYSCNS